MKKFSSLKEEIKPKYESKDSLKNEIYSIIEKSLSVKFSKDELVNEDVTIEGKEEMVEAINKLIETTKIKDRVSTLEKVKANVYRNFDMKWLNEEIENVNYSLNRSLTLNELKEKYPEADIDINKNEDGTYSVKVELKTQGDEMKELDKAEGLNEPNAVMFAQRVLDKNYDKYY